ncbi:MAG: hypothetical protein ACOCWR_03705, partial [Oceanidesulfovibrio sp.]
ALHRFLELLLQLGAQRDQTFLLLLQKLHPLLQIVTNGIDIQWNHSLPFTVSSGVFKNTMAEHGFQCPFRGNLG